MTAPIPGAKIHGDIQGDVHGQVAVGKYIVQIGSVHGGVVNVALPHERLQPQPPTPPVLVRPRPFPAILDRKAAVATATAALKSAVPIEFYGSAGLGKT